MIAVALALMAVVLQATAEPPRFAAEATRVHVDAFVAQRGKPMLGLAARDFELYDNGVKQQVELLDRSTAPLGAVLVLDTSGSVAGAPLEALRAAARGFVQKLGTGDQVALVSFSDSVQLDALSTDPAEIGRALDRLAARSATSLYDAIWTATRLPLPNPRRLLVVFTDGADTTSWLRAEDLQTGVASSGLLLYVITARDPRLGTPGTGLEWEASTGEFLRRLAESSGGRLLEADTREVGLAFARVLEELRGGYALGYEPQGVRLEGDHQVEVRVKRPGASVRARDRYSVRKREP